MNLKEFVQDRLGGVLLELSTEDIVPGIILDVERESGLAYLLKEIVTGSLYGQKFIVKTSDGGAWEYVKDPNKTAFTSHLANGNLIQSELKHELALGGKTSLPQYGITISGNLQKKYSAVLKVGKIQARLFDTPSVVYDAIQGLLALKKSNPEKWEWVNGDLLVAETYYTTELSWVFYGEGEVNAKADFKNAKFQASGEVTASWKSSNVLTLSGEPSVPFAVRGVWI